MSDIKSTLSLLCQQLKLSVNVTLRPEDFRSAKLDNSAEDVTAEFWNLLATLGLHAANGKGFQLDFREHDVRTTAKLWFACLQYPVLEFYNLAEGSSKTRQLLLAFAWLLGTQNVLDTVVRANLASSSLARECSRSDPPRIRPKVNNAFTCLGAEVKNIVHLSNRANTNMKEISELITERTKLACKSHAASVNVTGLPHLSVIELASLKGLSATKRDPCPVQYKNQLEELISIGSLLDLHAKWSRKEHVFFDWMLTVVQEQTKFPGANAPNVDWKELLQFMVLLWRMIKRRVGKRETSQRDCNLAEQRVGCVSRLLRTEAGYNETAEWSKHASDLLSQESEHLRKTKEELSKELKGILKMIPCCVQIQ